LLRSEFAGLTGQSPAGGGIGRGKRRPNGSVCDRQMRYALNSLITNAPSSLQRMTKSSATADRQRDETCQSKYFQPAA